MSSNLTSEKPAILHILVVGFHHKKGCQVEFSYPPLVEGENESSTNLPEEWKYLPFLALPDGAHNYNEDVIYFHLPPQPHYSSQSTVYGVSCYQQISAHLLKRKDDDVTRGTVQKCVVALSQLPIYGVLHSKLKMITQAYFEEKDFAKNDILIELFVHMNMSIKRVEDSKKYHELSPRLLVLTFQHKVLILFKLILLERKVLFYTSPVKTLAVGLMSLLSLFPDMIERGLSECTLSYKQYLNNLKVTNSTYEISYNRVEYIDKTKQQDLFSEPKGSEGILNNQVHTDDFTISNGKIEKNLSKHPGNKNSSISTDSSHLAKNDSLANSNIFVKDYQNYSNVEHASSYPLKEKNSIIDNHDPSISNGIVLSTLHNEVSSLHRQSASSLWEVTSEAALNIAASVSSKLEDLSLSLTATLYNEAVNDPQFDVFDEIEDEEEVDRLNIGFQNSRLEIKSGSPKKNDALLSSSLSPLPSNVLESDSQIDIPVDTKPHFSTDNNGFPLSVFTRGYLCHPYVALQQIPELTDNIERGYVIGATNVLFKTQSHLTDVVVDFENALVDIRNVDLKRQLHLSAADLRFAENLVSTVAKGNTDDDQWDVTSWEGGDEWVQAQFFDYLASLLATSISTEVSTKDINDFNEHFLDAWKRTKNYQVWLNSPHSGISQMRPAHPCQAQFSVNDMRLRLHHNLQSTDRGRKLEGAMNSANQAVLNTKKYMGTALISAKSSVSSWLSNKMKKET